MRSKYGTRTRAVRRERVLAEGEVSAVEGVKLTEVALRRPGVVVEGGVPLAEVSAPPPPPLPPGVAALGVAAEAGVANRESGGVAGSWAETGGGEAKSGAGPGAVIEDVTILGGDVDWGREPGLLAERPRAGAGEAKAAGGRGEEPPLLLPPRGRLVVEGSSCWDPVGLPRMSSSRALWEGEIAAKCRCSSTAQEMGSIAESSGCSTGVLVRPASCP